MTARDKDKIKVLIAEAKVWADSHKETDYIQFGENIYELIHLPITTVKMLLDQLKEKLLKDDDPNEDKEAN